jgi:hypothetical protein
MASMVSGSLSAIEADDRPGAIGETFIRRKWEIWRGSDVPRVLELKATMPEWQENGNGTEQVLIPSSTSTATTDKSIQLTVTYQLKITYVRGGLGQILHKDPSYVKHLAG